MYLCSQESLPVLKFVLGSSAIVPQHFDDIPQPQSVEALHTSDNHFIALPNFQLKENPCIYLTSLLQTNGTTYVKV